MENKNDKKNSTEGEATYIELVWDNTQDLIDLRNSPQFSNFILLKSYSSIKEAIEKDLDKVELFNVFNMSIIIELDRSRFHTVLENVTNHFINIEDYEECIKIEKLISKLTTKK
jgi:hypothetical protein